MASASGSWNIEWASGTWSGYPKSYHWSGNWSWSGSTISLSNMRLWFTLSGAGYASGVTDNVTVTGGSAQTVTWNFSGSSTSNIVSLNNTSFNSSTGRATINCVIDGENTGSYGINLPTAFSLSNIIPGTDSITATWSVGNWYSTPGTFECSLGNDTTYGSGLKQPRRYIEVSTSSLSTTQTISNSSAYSSGGFTISPNSRYYLFGYATNASNFTSELGYTSVVTLPPAPTLSLDSTTSDTVTLNYSTVADGGYHSKQIQYSLDGSTWTTGATVAGASASSGSFTITNLSAGTTYNIQTRVTTPSGSTAGTTVVATTSAPVTPAKLYGSVNGQTKQIVKLYGSVNGQTKQIVKLYGSVNGLTRLVYEV